MKVLAQIRYVFKWIVLALAWLVLAVFNEAYDFFDRWYNYMKTGRYERSK